MPSSSDTATGEPAYFDTYGEDDDSNNNSGMTVTREDVLYFSARQGLLRTMTAPLDRVKFVMEVQTELSRRTQHQSAPPSTAATHSHQGTSAAAHPGSSRARALHYDTSSHSTSSSFGSSRRRGGCSSKGAATVAAPFSTSWQVVRHIHRYEGTRGLWRGNGVQVMSIGIQSLCHFHLSEPVMDWTSYVLAPQSSTGELLAFYTGFLMSGFIASLIPYPLEFLRFHLAVDVVAFPRGSSTATLNAASSTVLPFNRQAHHHQIPHGLSYLRRHPVLRECPHYCFTGLGFFMLGSAVYFASHLLLSKWTNALVLRQPVAYPVDQSPPPPSILACVVSDGLATLLATAVAHPIDVLRRRRMLAVLQGPTMMYKSYAHCASVVLRREGVRGYFRGLPISLCRMIAGATSLQLVGAAEGLWMRRALANR